MDLQKSKSNTEEQFGVMAKEVEKMPILWNNGLLQGVSCLDVNNAWETIAQKLNAIGPPTRPTKEWIKSWSELKERVNAKRRQLNVNRYDLLPYEQIADHIDEMSRYRYYKAKDHDLNYEKRKKTSMLQFEIMVREVEKVPSLWDFGQLHGLRRREVEKMWEQIAQKLNAVGPTTRTTPEWKKVWCDLKGRIRAKMYGPNTRHVSFVPFEKIMEKIVRAIDNNKRQIGVSEHMLHINEEEVLKESSDDPLIEVLFDDDDNSAELDLEKPPVQRRKMNTRALTNVIKSLTDMLTECTAKLIETDENEDAIFATSVVSLLRSLDPSIRDSLKQKIYNCIFEGRLNSV